MADKKSVQKTYRLSPSVIEFVEALRKNRILGDTDAEVVRALIERGIADLIRDDYVRKYQDTLRGLQGNTTSE